MWEGRRQNAGSPRKQAGASPHGIVSHSPSQAAKGGKSGLLQRITKFLGFSRPHRNVLPRLLAQPRNLVSVASPISPPLPFRPWYSSALRRPPRLLVLLCCCVAVRRAASISLLPPDIIACLAWRADRNVRSFPSRIATVDNVPTCVCFASIGDQQACRTIRPFGDTGHKIMQTLRSQANQRAILLGSSFIRYHCICFPLDRQNMREICSFLPRNYFNPLGPRGLSYSPTS